MALASIGDAVITTDMEGRITFLNSVGESLTGWAKHDAIGKPLDSVFNIMSESDRQPVESPVARALCNGLIIGLANHTLLISRDGTERTIEDCAAPIRNSSEEVVGAVLVFRDISQRKLQKKLVDDARVYAENIIATLRHPLLVLDEDLRVVMANRSFYQVFSITELETQGCPFFELGKCQWDIPQLRKLLTDVLPGDNAIQDFDVEFEFPVIGRRFMQMNARRIISSGNDSNLKPQTSNLKPQTSNLKPQTSNLKPDSACD